MNIYFANPARGCGTKKRGGYYAESEMEAGGILNMWTWLLGDGLEGGENCLLSIPPRRAIYGNLAASLALGEFIPLDAPTDFNGLEGFYEALKGRTSSVALFDHVGSKFYTSWAFATEAKQYGPSRRIMPAMAEELAKYVPLPIVFTHSQMPLFRDEVERAEAVYFIEELMGVNGADLSMEAIWFNQEWGIYSGNDAGDSHYMTYILSLMWRLKKWTDKQDDLYQEARKFFNGLNYAEQPFGVSWITRVGYVPKNDADETDVADDLTAKGINLIDLNAPDPVPVMARVQEQRHNPLTGRFIGGNR